MCGIAGIVGRPVSADTLQTMAQAMVRRGPDDDGFYRGPNIGLAFRRLAIVDLASGRQPMANETGSVRVVFNGEIYDHAYLRDDLEKRGHTFVTDHSDTEVLVHGWEEWREQLFPKLNGMFAVAVWDSADHTLVLARDRFGIKPLYYAPLPGGGLAFASEVKAILASRLVPSIPNPEGILEYFTFQNLVGRQTMFGGIYQLPAGTILIWRNGRVHQSHYWDITFPRGRRSTFAELAEEHRAILKRVIKRQMAADVPVKTYLSGGIDSTAITLAAHRSDASVTAYSCIFSLEGVGEDRVVDEREFSRLVAHECGLQRVEVELSADSLIHLLQDYVSALEDPRMGMGYPVFVMAGRVAQDAKVVLSGTGGDELHAGYLWRFESVRDRFSSLPANRRGIRSWLRAARRWWQNKPSKYFPNLAAENAYRAMVAFGMPAHQLHKAFRPEFLQLTHGFDAQAVVSDYLNRCPSTDWRDRILYVDAKTYLAGLLTLEDKLSMHHSLETRVPLLDNELVDFVLDVPFESLCSGGVGKRLFRESVRPWVPEAIYHKPKMGFAPPDASWYRGPLQSWIRELLLSPDSRCQAILRYPFIRDMLERHFSGQADCTYFLWSLLNFEMWCRVFGFYGAGSLAYARSA